MQPSKQSLIPLNTISLVLRWMSSMTLNISSVGEDIILLISWHKLIPIYHIITVLQLHCIPCLCEALLKCCSYWTKVPLVWVLTASLTVLQRSDVGWWALGCVQWNDQFFCPKLSADIPAPPVAPADCERCPLSPLSANTLYNGWIICIISRMNYVPLAQFLRKFNLWDILTPSSLTLRRASCPDSAASIRSPSWFSRWSSTPCSKRCFLLAHISSSLDQSALRSSKVCWMSTTPIFPLVEPFWRDLPNFTISSNLSRHSHDGLNMINQNTIKCHQVDF